MKKLRFRTWTAPFAILLLCLVSFGLLIPWLGFYWDDWPVILMTRLQGTRGFLEFYQYDRPFSAWTYILSAPILGTHPLAWHLFTLLLRWLTILGMWWSLRGLWPQRTREVTWMALLFAIYPVFSQQPIAVAFSQHWLTFALYFLSLGAMIQSIRRPRWYWPLTLLGASAALLHLLTMEYFLGLELLRPVVLWLMSGERSRDLRKRLGEIIRLWLPYLLVLIVYVVWRVFFLKLAGEDPNRPDLLIELANSPVRALIKLFQMMLQDFAFILVGAWARGLAPENFDLGSFFSPAVLVLGFLTAVALVVYLSRLDAGEGDPQEGETAQQPNWVAGAITLGLLATLLGPLPVWLTGKQTVQGLYADRFGLAAMFGASVLIVGLMEWFTPRRTPKIILLSALVGLAVGFHLHNANNFRWIWTKQTRFYWQLAWRAPEIKPQTAILSDGELFLYVGDYSTSVGINLLYPQPASQDNLAYWFLDMDSNYITVRSKFVKGMAIKRSFRSFSYQGNSLDSLLISYEPEKGRCLWVLRPGDTDNHTLSDTSRLIAPVSNVARIEPGGASRNYPPTDIFGPEPDHSWCYYFEKAELARQQGDWQQIVDLEQEAQRLGHRPNDKQEWQPFIEGFARTGNWNKAGELTNEIIGTYPNLSAPLCQLWDNIQQSTNVDGEGQTTLSEVQARLNCAP